MLDLVQCSLYFIQIGSHYLNNGLYVRFLPECCDLYHFQEAPIHIRNIFSCCAMQYNVTSILYKLLILWPQFFVENHSPIFELMCTQLRIGNPILKKVNKFDSYLSTQISLKCMKQFVEQVEFSGFINNMLLETIVLLLKFGCSVDKWPSFR